MRKFIIILVILLGLVTFGLASDNTTLEDCDGIKYSSVSGDSAGDLADKCCPPGSAVILSNSVFICKVCDTLPSDILKKLPANEKQNCIATPKQKPCTTNSDCGTDAMCVDSKENPGTKTCIINNEGTLGLTMNSDCLINGQCSYNIYKTLGIRKSDQDPSVGSFMQDIVLALTTFIGTVIAVVLVVSGILYIISSIKGDSSLADKAKKGIVNSLMGLLIVVSSYAIVRLIQFVATAGGG